MALPRSSVLRGFCTRVRKARLETGASGSAARRLTSTGAPGLSAGAELSPGPHGAAQRRPRGQGAGGAAPRGRRAVRPLQELSRLCSPCPSERMASSFSTAKPLADLCVRWAPFTGPARASLVRSGATPLWLGF